MICMLCDGDCEAVKGDAEPVLVAIRLWDLPVPGGADRAVVLGGAGGLGSDRPARRRPRPAVVLIEHAGFAGGDRCVVSNDLTGRGVGYQQPAAGLDDGDGVTDQLGGTE